MAEGQDNLFSMLSVTIRVLDLAGEICSVTPAKPVLKSAHTLLVMVKVCLLSFSDGLPVHVSPGFDGQRTGLC